MPLLSLFGEGMKIDFLKRLSVNSASIKKYFNKKSRHKD